MFYFSFLRIFISYRILVNTDAKVVEFGFDNLFMRKRFSSIEDYENHVASASSTNDLSSTTTSIGGALDNTLC